MDNPPLSPISQLLKTLGITREDLEKRSDQMRQFLTTENTPSLRVPEPDKSHKHHKSSDSWSKPRSSSSTTSFSRSRSRANSFRDATPPMTPVKPGSSETSGSLRHYDSMEAVIERQRRQSRREKRERRERERDSMARTSAPQPSSPTPSNTSHHTHTANSTAQGRDARRVSFSESKETANTTLPATDPSALPVTPQRSRYYREHTILSSSQTNTQAAAVTVKTEAMTPTRCPSPSAPPSASTPTIQHPQVFYAPYPHYLPYSLLPPMFPTAAAGPSALPVTPQPHRAMTAQRKATFKSPLPPSSPPPASSPVATPRAVNLVSSPGPSAPLPDEDDYDKLPFKLPPGPYSPTKPDASYAALIGQAILSSPERKLTLQEIYDYITIVYPHFKRGEQTWMNSIRHVLSTTVCFRKVVRDRSQGRTQWTIYDDDLDCFKGGGFRKALCKEYANSSAAKDRAPGSRGKGKGKKRADNEDGSIDTRKAKKAKLDHEPITSGSAAPYHPPPISSHPIFPPTRPTPHHQPYYETCLQTQPMPGDIIFPPIPTDVGYTRISIPDTSPSAPSSTIEEHPSDPPPSSTPPPKSDRDIQPSSSSSSSLPELVQNSSSSNSSPVPATSDVDDSLPRVDIPLGSGVDQPTSDEEEEIRALEKSFLVPVKDWGASPDTPSRKRSRSPELMYPEESGQTLKPSLKFDERPFKKITFPPFPTSPTLDRKAESRLPKTSVASYDRRSDSPTPTTPPRTARQLPTSSVRTPLSSKGINPAALQTDNDDEDIGKRRLDRTPRKRVTSAGNTAPAPVTPRRLIFPTNQNDSPFRTPSGIFGTSPFRTPGSRAIFDPHDPGALLDDELNRLGHGPGDSPAGIFGKGRGSLLYDSPGLSTSPGRWW